MYYEDFFNYIIEHDARETRNVEQMFDTYIMEACNERQKEINKTEITDEYVELEYLEVDLMPILDGRLTAMRRSTDNENEWVVKTERYLKGLASYLHRMYQFGFAHLRMHDGIKVDRTLIMGAVTKSYLDWKDDKSTSLWFMTSNTHNNMVMDLIDAYYSIHSENRYLQEEHDGLLSEFSSLERKYAMLEDEYKDLSNEFRDLKNKLEDADASIEGLKEEIKALQDEIEALEGNQE